MNRKIRVLVIAPYEGMQTLMSSLADEYPEIDLNIFVGDLQKGVEIAKNSFHANYDVIISRGGTAKMLEQQFSLPVIEIENSINDILYALKLSGGLSKRTAIISFPNITTNAKIMCELLNYDIDIFEVESVDEVEPLLITLKKEKYDAILCDMVASTTAKRLGINTFLISSGVESLRQTLNRAVFLCRSQENLKYENLFLREVICGQISQTIIFDSNGELFFSTIENPSPSLLEMLRKEIGDTNVVNERRILRNISGMLYSIRSKRMFMGEHQYVAFFFSFSKTPLTSNQCGIDFFTCHEMEDKFYNSIFSISGAVNEMQDVILKLNQSTSPIMISGEKGTGKEYIANVLYTRSILRDKPFIFVNCHLFNDKSWMFLLEHHNSPLARTKNTIYFNDIDELNAEHRHTLLAALSDMGVCKRNRVIFSCSSQEETVSKAEMEFVDSLSCLTLQLPPLRELPKRIPPLVNLYLSRLNVNLIKQSLGVEPEAMSLLQEFSWPHNYTQLKRVINELAVTAAGPTITADEVQYILSKEKIAVCSAIAEYTALPLELNRTLGEIEKDIACRVLEKMNGNQTATAKSLGISRTTLWRLMRT